MTLASYSPTALSNGTFFVEGTDWQPDQANLYSPYQGETANFGLNSLDIPSHFEVDRPPHSAFASCPNLPVFGHSFPTASLGAQYGGGHIEAITEASRSSTPTVYDGRLAPSSMPTAALGFAAPPIMPPLSRSYSEGQLLVSQARPQAPSFSAAALYNRPAQSPTFLSMTPLSTPSTMFDSGMPSADDSSVLHRTTSAQSLSSSATSSYIGSPYTQYATSEASNASYFRNVSSTNLTSGAMQSKSSDNGNRQLAGPSQNLANSPVAAAAGAPQPVFSLTKTARSKPAPGLASPTKKARPGRLTDMDRKRICELARDTPGLGEDVLAHQFSTDSATVIKTLKESERWLAAADKSPRKAAASSPVGNPGSPSKATRSCRFPQVETEVIAWAREETKNGRTLTDAGIKSHALAIAAALRIPIAQFKASHGWMERFKVRAKITQGKIARRESDGEASEPPSPAPSTALNSSVSTATSSFQDDAAQDHEDEDVEMASSYSSASVSASFGPTSSTPSSLSSSASVLPSPHAAVEGVSAPGFPRPAAPTAQRAARPPSIFPQPAEGYRTIYNAARRDLQTPIPPSPMTPESPTFFISAQPPHQGQPQLAHQQARDASKMPPPRRATISVPAAEQRVFQPVSAPMVEPPRPAGLVQLPEALHSLQVIRQFLYEQPALAAPVASQALSELHTLLSRVAISPPVPHQAPPYGA